MTKEDLIKSLKEETDVTGTDIEAVLGALPSIMTEEMQNKGTIRFPNFGVFSTIERAARKGRNPSNGKAIDIPASTSVKFKASDTLKRAMK